MVRSFRESEIPRLVQARRLFLFLDYDGTLAAIASRPGKALLPSKTRELLREIGALSGVRLAFLSGRSVGDLEAKIGLRGFIYVGNHGLEMKGERFSWTHPKAREVKPLLERIALQLRRTLPRFPGLILENKGFGISLHYRLVEKRRVTVLYQALRKTCGPWIAAKKVTLHEGKKVWEIRPCIAWDKGRAVGHLLKKYQRQGKFLPVCIGDDRTDEDAFQFLKKRGMTIRVGKETAQTGAQFRLESPAQVYHVLKRFYIQRAASS